MELKDVRKSIVMNRSMTEMASLPFLIKKNNAEAISWFTYNIKKNDDKIYSDVKKIMYTTDGKDIVSEYSVQSVELKQHDDPETPITEKEYYEKLAELMAEENYEKMIELLSLIAGPMMEAYIAVQEYISEYEAGKEQVVE